MKKKSMVYILSFIFGLYTIVFFREHILLTWDSSEYLGMSLAFGTSTMKTVWIAIRGLSFPLLLRIFEPGFWQNKYMLLIMLYLFFVLMLYTLYKITKEVGAFNHKQEKLILLVGIIITIVLNPYIFLYYHTILTEFVIMTLNMVFVYLLYKYVKLDFNKDRKKSIVLGLLLGLLIIFIYHLKQSFIGMILIDFVIGMVLSFVSKRDFKNIMFRICTFLFCIFVLVVSINIWDSFMSSNGEDSIIESTEIARVKKRLLSGINELTEVGDDTTLYYLDDEFLDNNGKTVIINNYVDKEKMKLILDKNSEYTGFTVYNDNNSMNQYVLYTKGQYSLKEQLILYLKIFLDSPSTIFKSYFNGLYWTTIKSKDYHFENTVHAKYYYDDNTNILNVSPNYTEAVSKLADRPVISLFDRVQYILSFPYQWLYSLNILILPLLFIISSIIYIVEVSKKTDSLIRRNIEMIVLLYGMAIGCVLTYIIFGAYIDRYLVPCHIPMFMGDILLIILICRIIKRNSKA